MGAGALGAAGMLVPTLRRARAAGDLDASALLVLALGWLVSLPIVVAVITGSVVKQMDDDTRELATVNPDWYEKAAYLSLALVMVLAAVLVVRRLISGGRSVTLHAAGLLAILLWGVAWLASGLQGGRLISLSGVALLVCLLAATVLPRGRGAAVGAGIFGVTLAIGSGLMAAVNLGDASVACRHECVLGPAITGLLPNENLLGTTLLATLPFAYLGFRSPGSVWLTLYVAAMAITTGSRSAMVIAIVVLLALLVVRPRLDAERAIPGRAAVAGVLVAVGVLASAYIVQRDWGASAYSLTDRPQLWQVASEYVEDSPLFGYGPDKWETLYEETGEIPRAGQHSTHNQWMDVRFTAGWVGAALLAAIVTAMVWSAAPARAAVLTVLATIFLIGIAERAWATGLADFVSFSLVALILLGPVAAGPRESSPGRSAPERLGRSTAEVPAQGMA